LPAKSCGLKKFFLFFFLRIFKSANLFHSPYFLQTRFAENLNILFLSNLNVLFVQKIFQKFSIFLKFSFLETDGEEEDVDSDEEELERLVCSDSKKPVKKTIYDEEINPFSVNLGEEVFLKLKIFKKIFKDPWADVQGTSEDTTPLPEIENIPKVTKKKKKAKKHKKSAEMVKKHIPLLKPEISNVTVCYF